MTRLLAGVEWEETDEGLQHRFGKLRCLVAVKPLAGVWNWQVLGPKRLHLDKMTRFAASQEFAAREALQRAEQIVGEAVEEVE